MTDEQPKGSGGLRHGLPRVLTDDANRLNKLLQLTRRDRLHIGTLVPKEVRARITARLRVRPESAKPGEADRVVVQVHYGHPAVRRAAWLVALEQGPGGKPSPEWHILEDFVAAEREVSGEPADSQTESDRIADRAWAAAKEQLGQWDSLEEPEREQCVLRAFAVATLRDDQTVLTEAVELAPDLHDQFAALLPEEEDQTEADGVPGGTQTASDKWSTLTASLKDLVTRAEGPPPNPDLLDGIAKEVDSLREIEPDVRAETSSSAFEDFLTDVRKRLDEIEKDPLVRWDSGWRTPLEETWEKASGEFAGGVLDAERRRFEAAVGRVAEEVQTAAQDLADATKEIESHRAGEPEDPIAQEAWDGELKKLQRTERKCRKRLRKTRASLLTAVSPGGVGIDVGPSRPKSETSPEASKPKIPDREEPSDSPEPEPPGPEDPSGPSAVVREPEGPPVTPKPAPTPRSETTKSERRKPPASPGSGKRHPPPGATAKPQPPPSPRPPVPKPSKPRDPLAVRAEEAIAAALVEEPPRLAYAFWVARLSEQVFADASSGRSLLLEAALLADRLRLPDGVIATRLGELFQDFPVLALDNDEEETVFHVAAAFAASLRPAIFAPNTGAFAILTNLPPSERFPAVGDLARRIATHAEKLQRARIDSSHLNALRSDEEMHVARERSEAALTEWLRDAPRRTMLYAPATAVWKRWLQRGGVIGNLMVRIRAGVEAESGLSGEIERLRDAGYVKELVERTNRELRGGGARRATIQARALQKLVHEARRAAELGTRYLNQALPVGSSDHWVRRLTALRKDLDESAPAVLDELQQVTSSGSAGLAVRAIEQLQAALHPSGNEDSGMEPEPSEVLASGFFATRTVLDEAGRPVGEPRELLASLVERDPLDSVEVVRGHLGAGSLGTARRILDWVAGEDRGGLLDLQPEFEAAHARHSAELQDRRIFLGGRLETGLMLGSVSADERERISAVLVRAERQLKDPDFLRFADLRGRLTEIDSALDDLEESSLRKVRNELAELKLPADSARATAIERAISQRDIVTANERIQQARENPDAVVPEPKKRVILREFFPAGARAISDEIEGGGFQQGVQRIQGGKPFPCVPGGLPGASRDSAARMLHAWSRLKRRTELGQEGERSIGELFSEIGFLVRSLHVERESTDSVVMRTVPLEGANQCPIPKYGSAAKGAYRVICCWNRPRVDDLLQYGDQQSGSGFPPIVLYLGRLSERQRTDLAAGCREQATSLLVLDELVLFFLCGERESRLPAFFHCTLPFTYVQPYSAVGGAVPPEMFYGRANELREVRSKTGPCFIYGGRQLGKTAILRAVEAREHRPAEGRHVFFIDLKAHEIGVHRDIGDIWSVLWRTLRKGRAIPDEVREPSLKGAGRIEEFLDALVRHFAPDTGRTLLLLLDEADRFLDLDAREQDEGVAATGYRESIRLKRLMDDTERSIKVVFAGLHNVLRAHKETNHPLGQFGNPISVEPLLHNGGMRAAQELVTRPLLAAGYEFEPSDLVTRILAHTNYYPGLIQAYGKELLETLLSQQVREFPCKVDHEAIDKAYRAEGLREFIRDRFHLTLNLDQRYEVIAYSIAYLCLSEEDALVDGASRDAIYREALECWQERFREMGTERIEALLDEMAGLGVLRKIKRQKETRYSLRNPNVLLLLGTEQQITDKLAERREARPEFEPRVFRARLKPGSAGDPSRSLLTFQQEARLFAEEDGVVLLAGTQASGLRDLVGAFGSRADRSLRVLHEISEPESFRAALRLNVKRQEEGVRVHTVPLDVPWTGEWIRTAQQYVRSLRKTNRKVRVLFLSEGDRLYEIIGSPRIWKAPGLEQVFLEPWADEFVRQWMQDMDIGDSTDLRGRIVEATGSWPSFLMQFHASARYLGSAGEALKNLEAELADGEQQAEYRRKLCLEDTVTRAVLRPLADYGELRREEVVEAAGDSGVSREDAERRLTWAGRLGLARSRLKWSINPLVGRLLGADQA